MITNWLLCDVTLNKYSVQEWGSCVLFSASSMFEGWSNEAGCCDIIVDCDVATYTFFEFFFVNVSITAGNRSEHFIIKAADFSLSLQKNVIYKLKSRNC